MTRLKLLETLSNNKVQDILEEMGMLENGNCPYTAEEIFKAGVEYAQDHIESNEKNIFENAYFGKAYKTRDGRKAIYTIMSCDSHWLAIQDTSFTWEYNDNGKLASNIDNALDIVSEWEEPINEEIIDKACEWLEENSDTFYTIEGDSTCEMLFETAEDMIAYFRKAMKGE